MTSSISRILDIIDGLPEDVQTLFNRFYDVSVNMGKLVPPEEMHEWIEENIASLEQVTEQEIVRIENKITHEATLYNELRAKRPIDSKMNEDLEAILNNKEDCDFCHPLDKTPADSFGRLHGKHCITASNIAKYDALHGLVIFNRHYPLVHDEELIKDYVETARRWFERAHQQHQDMIFPLIMWNCTWRAGASITHGHWQLLLTSRPYPKVAFLNECRNQYNTRYATSYLDSLYTIHKALGLGFQWKGIKLLVHLTPIKEKECMFFGASSGEGLAHVIARLVGFYYAKGVRALNLAIYLPPLQPAQGWEDFPVVGRLVDRGNPMSNTTDIGAMELYACSVVSSDPFKLAADLRKWDE